MDDVRRDIRAAFEREQAGLGDTRQVERDLIHRAVASSREHPPVLRLAGAAATLIVAAAVAIAVLLSHGHLRPAPTQAGTIEQALTAGAPAAIGAVSNRAFVWLVGDVIEPTPTASQGGQLTGIRVKVLDWTGAVRHQFVIPVPARALFPTTIQAISADGTRALLGDGTVLDETGATVGKIAALQTRGMPGDRVVWLGDDRVCAASSNEQYGPQTPMPPKGQGTPPPRATPLYMQPGADHSVTLKLYGLDGSVRTVATFGTGSLGEPSGFMGDSTGVVACSAASDMAVVARYHDADNNPADNSSTNMTVSLWAIKLSTGAVISHTPETRMALGRAFFFGSQNAQLAVEFLWNSKVWGSEIDTYLRMPSGHAVPVLDAEASSDTAGLSGDGTRILRRVIEGTDKNAIELIDASDGRIIRRVEIPSMVSASAVAQPGGSSFMVDVEGYIAIVDDSGGVSLLYRPGDLGTPGVGIPFAVQG